MAVLAFLGFALVILLGMGIIAVMVEKTREERSRKSDERKLYYDSQDRREG